MDIQKREISAPCCVQLLWRQPTALHRQVFAWWSHLLRKPTGELKTVSILVCGCRWHYLDARFHELISPLQSLWLDDFNVGAVGACSSKPLEEFRCLSFEDCRLWRIVLPRLYLDDLLYSPFVEPEESTDF